MILVERWAVEVQNCEILQELVIPENRSDSTFTAACLLWKARQQSVLSWFSKVVRLAEADGVIFAVERENGDLRNKPQVICCCTGCIYNSGV